MIPLLFSVLMLASGPSDGPTQATSEPAEQAAPVKKEKKICKDDPAYTGSRMSRKICLTESDWEKRRVAGLQNASQMGRSYTSE